MNNLIFMLALLLSASELKALELFTSFPAEINAGEKYVFYSHGLIVEGEDPIPEHPKFGEYDFPGIKNALFEDADFNLIAEQRTANTRLNEYVEKLAGWVNALLSAGVQPENITLVGFSRGAQITALTSNMLNEKNINTVLLGVCSNGDYAEEKQLKFGGHVLSIYEVSDVVGSCHKLLSRSAEAKSTREIAISTQLEHGAFYKPYGDWMLPLKEWLSEI